MAREKDTQYSEYSLLEVIRNGSRIADNRHARGIRHPLASILGKH